MNKIITNPLTRQGIVINDCGTGSGGFKSGNSCAKGGGGSSGKSSTSGAVEKPRSKKAKKRTITQAAKELEKKGYHIKGVESYDLKNKTAHYSIQHPDGKTSVMTVKQIEDIIGN